MRKDNSDIKNSLAISLIVLIGKMLGFVKQAVIAWAFGAGATTDIFFAADGYTSMFGQIMGQSIAPTVLTRYVKLDAEGKKSQAVDLIKHCFLFFGIIGVSLVAINILLSSRICNLIGISYSVEQKTELKFFLIALCPVILFTSLSGVAQGYLDAHKRFLPAKLCSLFFSISIIVSVFAFRKELGIRALLYGFLFGYAAHTLFMLALSMRKTGIILGNPFKSTDFRQMLGRLGPLVVGNSIVDLGHLIDKIVASSLVTGSVSALYYGQVISSDLVNAVIISSIGTVLLTSLTKNVSAKADKVLIVSKLQKTICTMTLLTGFVSIIYFIEGRDFISLFFERGNFDASSSVAFSSIASFYAVGFIFMANREVLIKAHYAFQDTLTPMINSIIGVTSNLFGSIVLSKYMGVSGVAFATSLSMLVVTIVSLFTIKKHIDCFPINRQVFWDLLKIIICMSSSALIGVLSKRTMTNMNMFLRILIISFVVGLSYILLAILLKENVITAALLAAREKRKNTN